MSASLMIPAAEAAVPGARCSKANAKIKIGKESYTCTANPNVKSKRLVWVLDECIASAKAYRDGQETQKKVAETAAQTITMLKVDIENLKVQIAAKEPEAKTWDAKVAEYKAKAEASKAKAAELKASAAKGGITAVDSKFKLNLQVALFDKKLTSAEINTLATNWSTTTDKVPFIIDFIAAEDHLRAANSYETSSRNAQRKADALRSNDLIDLKNKQIKSAETNVSLGETQLNSLLETRRTVCKISLWKAIS
jgi:hypothetical protein